MDRKIIITGSTCSGKTTLGKQLSNDISIPQIDLDELHFLPNWVEKDKSIFVQDVVVATKGLDDWIITGNHQSLMKDTILQEAPIIVWLDYPLHLIIRRYFIRTWRRVVYKEKCCGENYETLGRVFSKESLFLWIFKSYWQRKSRMNNWMNNIFSHKEWIVLRNPKEEKRLIDLI